MTVEGSHASGEAGEVDQAARDENRNPCGEGGMNVGMSGEHGDTGPVSDARSFAGREFLTTRRVGRGSVAASPAATPKDAA